MIITQELLVAVAATLGFAIGFIIFVPWLIWKYDQADIEHTWLVAAAKWVAMSVHTEDCSCWYDDETGEDLDKPSINDDRCDCGLRDQFTHLPKGLQASILAAEKEATL